MKKTLSLILILALSSVLMLTACSGGGNEGDGAMNAEKWEDMLSAPNFENYTLKETATVMGYTTSCTVKMTNGKVEIALLFEGETEPTVIVYEGNDAAAQKKGYEELFLTLLADFDNFTYDEAAKVYKNPNPINAKIAMTVEGVSTLSDITMTNGAVTLSEDGQLLKFDCDYAQTTTTPEGPISITTHMYMEFSNYGTTVIE